MKDDAIMKVAKALEKSGFSHRFSTYVASMGYLRNAKKKGRS